MDNVAVGEVMSTPAVTVSSLAPLDAAAAIMVEAEVHRLVAVDDVGQPIGVLSAMDYVRLATEGA
jgi:CBS domain-containing protein